MAAINLINCFLYAFCLIPFLIAGCGQYDQKKSNVVIVVGSRQITTDELIKDIEFIGAGMDVPAQQWELIRKQLLEQVIDHYLIMEYGKENGITISEAELKRALKEIKREYTEKAFKDALLREYVDYDEWKNRLKEQLLIDKIIRRITENVLPPDHQEIERYYKENQDEFRAPEMLKFRQIVVRTKEEAEDLLKRLKDGEDMGELAGKYSIAPESESGGEVGWVARGQLDESMEKALFSLRPGKVSPVLKTPYGYHIFEVLSLQSERVKKLPEVVEEIETKLLSERRERSCQEWLQGLRALFEVKVNEDLLNTLELS
jgi:parvulin-like peptidyl-prolyl isomerase